MRALVTGGAGFIGSYLVDALIKGGAKVRILDDLSSGENINPRAEFIECNILEVKPEYFHGIDVIFHFAAIPSVPLSVIAPMKTHRVCAEGTLRILQEANDAGVRRIIYAGTSASYGNQFFGYHREQDPTYPTSIYGAAKLAGEHYCRSFNFAHGLEVVILRIFNVYGPRQQSEGAVIPSFVGAILRGLPLMIHGDGCQRRDFIHVEDVVRICLRSLMLPNICIETFNVGNGESISVTGLATLIGRLSGKTLNIEMCLARPGDVFHSVADISRIQDILDYSPSVKLEDGLYDLIKKGGQFLAAPLLVRD